MSSLNDYIKFHLDIEDKDEKKINPLLHSKQTIGKPIPKYLLTFKCNPKRDYFNLL